MTNKHRLRRGMTLAEIMICIAVVAIAVVMVTSFSVTMGSRMSRSKAQLESREELEALEKLTDAWLNAVLNEKKTQRVEFVLSAGEAIADGTITALLGDAPAVEGEPDTRTTLTLNWQHNYLTGTRPGTDAEGNPVAPITFRTQHVTGVQFYVTNTKWVEVEVEIEIEDGQGNVTGTYIETEWVQQPIPDGDMLFYCKVDYEIPMGNAKQPVPMTHIFCINPHMGDTVK